MAPDKTIITMSFKADSSQRFIFAFLPFLAGFIVFFTTCDNIAKSLQAESWSLVKGLAVRDFQGKYEFDFRYHFTFRTAKTLYRYQVEGRKYSGSAVGFGVFTGISDVNKGDIVGVYVNPENASESTLVTGLSNSHIFSMLGAAGCFFLGLFLWRRT